MCVKHGTRSKYINESCRCPKCGRANKRYLQEYRTRKAQANGKVTKRGR